MSRVAYERVFGQSGYDAVARNKIKKLEEKMGAGSGSGGGADAVVFTYDYDADVWTCNKTYAEVDALCTDPNKVVIGLVQDFSSESHYCLFAESFDKNTTDEITYICFTFYDRKLDEPQELSISSSGQVTNYRPGGR